MEEAEEASFADLFVFSASLELEVLLSEVQVVLEQAVGLDRVRELRSPRDQEPADQCFLVEVVAEQQSEFVEAEVLKDVEHQSHHLRVEALEVLFGYALPFLHLMPLSILSILSSFLRVLDRDQMSRVRESQQVVLELGGDH